MQEPLKIQLPPPSQRIDALANTAPPVNSEALLGPRGELVIEHRGRAYCLRITQNGKLILTA